MKNLFFVAVLGLIPIISSSVQAQNLLKYVELQIHKNDLIAFSSQAIRVRACAQCSEFVINTSPHTTYWQQNTEIELKQATELFVKRKYDSISIFYDQKTMTFDQFVFGGFIEDQSFQHLNNPDQ